MDARRESEPAAVKHRTTAERKSDRELVTTRTFDGPARIVFEAWTKPELLKQWWAPKSFGVAARSTRAFLSETGTWRAGGWRAAPGEGMDRVGAWTGGGDLARERGGRANRADVGGQARDSPRRAEEIDHHRRRGRATVPR